MTSNLLPNLIIAGVVKGGTTSLFTYLSRHPEICASSIKETDYFSPIARGGALPPLETYGSYFRDCKQGRYRMEASPGYIFGGLKLAEAIRKCLPSARVLFAFREPVNCFVSYFKHSQSEGELPAAMSCDEYTSRALGELPAVLAKANGRLVNVYHESIFTRGLAEGFYADYLDDWYLVFPDCIRVCFSEHLKKDPGSVVRGLCEWLSLDPSVYQDMEFTQENRTMVHKNAKFFAVAERINTRYESFWRRHAWLKRFARDLYSWINEARSSGDVLSTRNRTSLESVYAPHNQRLMRMLRERGYQDFPDWLSGYATN